MLRCFLEFRSWSRNLLSAPQTSFQVFFVMFFSFLFYVFLRFLAFFGGFGGFRALFSASLGFFTSIALGFVPKDPNWSGNGPKQNFHFFSKKLENLSKTRWEWVPLGRGEVQGIQTNIHGQKYWEYIGRQIAEILEKLINNKKNRGKTWKLRGKQRNS